MREIDEISKKLREYRIRRGFRQEDVSRALDISRQAVVSIESGKRRITISEFITVTRLYQLTLEEFLEICDLQSDFVYNIPKSVSLQIQINTMRAVLDNINATKRKMEALMSELEGGGEK